MHKESIDTAIKENNPQDVQLYAHKLKGAVRVVGADKLAEKAYQLECEGKENNADAFADIFEDLKVEFEKLKSFLALPNWIELAKGKTAGK